MADKSDIIVATVVSIDDPDKMGRIKVDIPGSYDNMKKEEAPWCNYALSSVFSGNGGGQISIPRVGQQVRVKYKDPSDANSLEWLGPMIIDKDMIGELKEDYAGSTVLMYDSGANASIKFQPGSGLLLYFKGSHILICPDNTINIHYGEGSSGTQILLSDGKINIQATNDINLTTRGNITLKGNSIVLDADAGVKMRGDSSSERAINGVALMNILTAMATAIDAKNPPSPGSLLSQINGAKEGLLNQEIEYFMA